jgi:hypothetical protein
LEAPQKKMGQRDMMKPEMIKQAIDFVPIPQGDNPDQSELRNCPFPVARTSLRQ